MLCNEPLTCPRYGGKLQRIERQIHHYGSGLNSLVLLSAFRSDPTDTYLLQVGYGGNSGPLSSINQDGFAAASFHSWPDTLKWDGISGDYGPNFLALVLGSGTYVANDPDIGLVAYGALIEVDGTNVTGHTRDPVRRRLFIGPLNVFIAIDAGIIADFTFDETSGAVTLTLQQLEGVPLALSTVVWIENVNNSANYTVTTPTVTEFRGGWQVPLTITPVVITLGSS